LATSSYAKSLIGALEAPLKKAFGDVFDYLLTNSLAFGPIDADATQSKTTNFLGRYVKVTTSSVASREIAVAHGLGRAPNVMWQVTSPRVVNSRFLGDLTVSRAADETRIYLTSASTSATIFLYVE
jgi:hypothetical protein